MDDKLLQRGGYVGAVIAFVVTYTTVVLLILGQHAGAPGGKIRAAFFGGLCISLFPTVLGQLAGREGARSKTVRSAFIKGGVFFGCAMSVYFVVVVILLIAGKLGGHAILVTANLSCLIICTGSLVSGMAAVVVRDYRQFERTRLFPQFSLQELMIVITLAAVIMSNLMSMALLRL